MQQALYRKYRSKKLADVIGQDHVTAVLSKALENSLIRHAYLFTGPHGVGKTSVARILAHLVNKLDYDGTQHLDIIEIDAASNRRIDEVRDLREKAGLAPSSAAFKVYIIDEVHMLTTEAFNALLKTLEEPPSHVIFILATTEAHKLPETIISRTQSFRFRPVPEQKIVKHLKSIAKKENLKVADKALAIIAKLSGGSVRDALSALDQVSSLSEKAISAEDINGFYGLPAQDLIDNIISAIIQQDSESLFKQLQVLRSDGYAPETLAKQTIQAIHTSYELLSTTGLLQLASKLMAVSKSTQPQRALEAVLLGATINSMPPAVPPTHSKPITKATTISVPAITATSRQPEKATANSQDQWIQVLDQIKRSNNSLYSILRMGQISFKGDILDVRFKFPFHLKKVSGGQNRLAFEEAVQAVYGQKAGIKLSLDENAVETVTETESSIVTAEPTQLASSVLDIMGGGEVVDYEGTDG